MNLGAMSAEQLGRWAIEMRRQLTTHLAAYETHRAEADAARARADETWTEIQRVRAELESLAWVESDSETEETS